MGLTSSALTQATGCAVWIKEAWQCTVLLKTVKTQCDAHVTHAALYTIIEPYSSISCVCMIRNICLYLKAFPCELARAHPTTVNVCLHV